MKKVLIVIAMCVSLTVLTGCGKQNNQETVPAKTDTTTNTVVNKDLVEQGDSIAIDYIGSTQEGGVFDTSIEASAKEAGLYNEARNYQPLSFTVGGGSVIQGMEKGVIGMKLGETKTLEIPVEEAYGERLETRVQNLPLTDFEQNGVTPKVGETYRFGMVGGKVTEVTEDSVTLDFNNPLAGKDLTFEVTIKEINKVANGS